MSRHRKILSRFVIRENGRADHIGESHYRRRNGAEECPNESSDEARELAERPEDGVFAHRVLSISSKCPRGGGRKGKGRKGKERPDDRPPLPPA